MRFRTPGNTTASWESSEDLKRYGRYSGVASVRQTRSSCWFLLQKSRLALESAASGSRLLSGSLSAEAAKKLKDSDGESLEDVRSKAGFRGDLDEVKLPGGYYKAFVELHIEQGPVLERQQTPLGVVTNIAAPASMRIVIEGAGGHAGGVLMPDRRDALCAAAELILAIENAARSSGAVDTVATVGMCEVFPGAINSIPSRVRLSADIRDTDLQRRDGVIKAMEDACNAISANRQSRSISSR